MASSKITEQGSRGERAEVSACVCTSMATIWAGSILQTYLLIVEASWLAGQAAAGTGRDAWVWPGSDAQNAGADKISLGGIGGDSRALVRFALTRSPRGRFDRSSWGA
jgi:hypothetical protein